MTPIPFLSELRIFSSEIVPKGWAACNGQLLPISQFIALYSVIGTTFGGDGRSNFALPNLIARVPLHRRFDLPMGSTGGEETHTLTIAEIPNHTHQAIAGNFLPDRSTPENNFWTVNPAFNPYGSQLNNPPMASGALQTVGQDHPHDNMAPFLVLNICIALEGIFPTPGDKNNISDPWTSEIRMFTTNLIPYYWNACDGQDLPVASNLELFSLIGTMYGGNGATSFRLPNLQAAAPLMAGQGNGLSPYDFGEKGGAATVTLTENEIPQHTHAAMAKESGDEGEPENRVWANPGSQLPLPNFYSSDLHTDPKNMNAAAIGKTGGSGAHNNMMPYGVLTFCITTFGTNPPG